MENFSSKTQLHILETKLENIPTNQVVEDLREDMKTKAEKHDLEIMHGESESIKKLSQTLPSREEMLTRLDNHA